MNQFKVKKSILFYIINSEIMIASIEINKKKKKINSEIIKISKYYLEL
jgi:hypothetical protein